MREILCHSVLMAVAQSVPLHHFSHDKWSRESGEAVSQTDDIQDTCECLSLQVPPPSVNSPRYLQSPEAAECERCLTPKSHAATGRLCAPGQVASDSSAVRQQ